MDQILHKLLYLKKLSDIAKKSNGKKFIDCGVVSLSHIDRLSVRPLDTNIQTDSLDIEI